MPARVDLSELPQDVREQLGLAVPRARGGKRRRMSMDDVRGYSCRVLGVLASLSQSERRRVLAHALKANDV